LLDLPETDEILNDEIAYAYLYITPTLELTGTDDPAYATMKAAYDGQEFSLAHRFCQYSTLFDIASLTKPGGLNADIEWENESAVKLDVGAANAQSLLWRK
jgi:hypothetical protein